MISGQWQAKKKGAARPPDKLICPSHVRSDLNSFAGRRSAGIRSHASSFVLLVPGHVITSRIAGNELVCERIVVDNYVGYPSIPFNHAPAK